MKIKLSVLCGIFSLLFAIVGCTPETNTPTPVISEKPTVAGTEEPADSVDQTLVRSVMAVLITTKEKNYGKQYDVLLCTSCKTSLTREEYIEAWSTEFEGVTLQNVTMPQDSSMKISGNKAEITPSYKLSAEKDYTPKNASIKTLKFIREEDGMWKLDWSK